MLLKGDKRFIMTMEMENENKEELKKAVEDAKKKELERQKEIQKKNALKREKEKYYGYYDDVKTTDCDWW